MIGVNSDIPYDFVTSVLHNKPPRRSSNRSNSNSSLEMPALPQPAATTAPKKCCRTPKHRPKREKLFTAPERVSDFLNHDSNKLIHLDPVPLFRDKAEIKPWLQKIFFPQGIDLVIERSDKSKIIFKCKAVTRPLATPEEAAITEADNTMTPPEVRNPPSTTDSSRTPIVTTNCPFRIRASYSLKMRKWNIVIVNNTHSHQCVFNPESDEYKKFKNYLLAEGETATIKEFEELEYKTKFKLPILPKVISCECGLTSEVNWFDITIPEPKISGTKKVMKKVCQAGGAAIGGGSGASSSTNLSRSNTANVELSRFLDLNSGNINIINSKTVTPPGNITNLDEIDFTNMFAAPKKTASEMEITNAAPTSLFQRTSGVKHEETSATFSTDDFNFNKIITTPSNENLLSYSMGFNDVNQEINDADLDALLKEEEPHTVDSNGTTTETSVNTMTEPTDVGYLDFLDEDICNLDLDKAAARARANATGTSLDDFNQVQIKADPFNSSDPFAFDSLM